MPNKIKPKRSYTASNVPLASELETHELAIRWDATSPAMFTKNAAGQIVTVTLGGAADSRWDLFLPPAPTGLTVTAGNAQAALSWTAPTGVIAQAPITDYRQQFSTDNGTTWTTFTGAAASTATTATVTGLTNGQAVRFRVAAVNGVGVGAFTAASSAVTPGTPPNAPTSLTGTAGNAQIALAWTAPSAPGASAISGYTVEYTPSGGSAQTVSTGSTGTSYTLTGLTNGTAYTVRVAGVSAAGTGTYSTSVSRTPNSVLLAISGSDTANWTGSGTAASKFTRGSAISRNGCNEIFPFVFEALATATFRASGSTTDNSGDTDDHMQIQIWNNALSSVVSTLFFGRGSFDITASISAGQKVRWRKNCNSVGDHQLNGGVTVWAE
jgi:cellulose 1,4-beta-cellobiosidase